jgi:hypothetical protein
MGEEVHDGVLNGRVRQGVATDVSATGVPLKELEVGDENAVAVAADEKAVSVWHVYDGASFGTVLVAGVESDVVLDVKFPHPFVVL